MKKGIKISLPLTSAIWSVLVLLWWVWLFCVTQPATAVNTYNCQTESITVEAKFAAHRGTDKLYISTENGTTYMLDTMWRNDNKTKALAERILSADKPITMTVWEHYPKWILDSPDTLWSVKQVVNLSNRDNVYWEIAEHNKYQKSERIFGIVIGVFLTAFVGCFDYLVCISDKNISKWFSRFRRRRKRR